MSVQSAENLSTVPFIRSGESLVLEGQTISQDAGRTAVLAKYTVMAKTAATQEWVPLTSLTATDGSSIAQGIYLGDDIAAATLVAGDVTDAAILVGGACTVDENQVVLDEGTLAIDDVFSASDATNVYFVQTIRDFLAQRGIFLEATVDIDGYENA